MGDASNHADERDRREAAVEDALVEELTRIYNDGEDATLDVRIRVRDPGDAISLQVAVDRIRPAINEAALLGDALADVETPSAIDPDAEAQTLEKDLIRPLNEELDERTANAIESDWFACAREKWRSGLQKSASGVRELGDAATEVAARSAAVPVSQLLLARQLLFKSIRHVCDYCAGRSPEITDRVVVSVIVEVIKATLGL